MPALQYPNKSFKLFTDASKHNYSGILYQEKEGQANTDEPELTLTAYFSGTLIKPSNFETLCRKNDMQSSNWLNNLLSVLWVPTAHCIETINF